MNLSNQKIGVILCACGGLVSRALNLGELAGSLQNQDTSFTIKQAEAVCDEPFKIREFIAENHLQKIVIGCTDNERYKQAFMEESAKANLGPFALEIVDLRHLAAQEYSPQIRTQKAKLLVLAKLSHIAKLGPVPPQSVKIKGGTTSGKVTRRDFLRGFFRTYNEVIPYIEPAACQSRRGCRLCLPACSYGAFAVDNKTVSIVKEKCVGCGACIPACPTGAIVFPTNTPAEIDAEIRTLVSNSNVTISPRIIAFTCAEHKGREESPLDIPENLLPVEVPCIGMVDTFLMLRTFDLGADGVAILGCGLDCKHRFNTPRFHSDVRLAKQLLHHFGIQPERLEIFEASSIRSSEFRKQVIDFVSRVNALNGHPLKGEAPTEVTSRAGLASLLGGFTNKLAINSSFELRDAALPYANVLVGQTSCTLCGLCAQRCPPMALRMEEKNEVTLSFDYSACVGCGICAAVCPEKSMKIDYVFDLRELLSKDKKTVASDLAVFCSRCGKHHTNYAMMRKISRSIRDPRMKQLLEENAKLCPDCKSLDLLESRVRASPPTNAGIEKKRIDYFV